MDLRLATLKAASFYLLHNFSTLNQRRKFSCRTVVCKHFASYQDYPNYRKDLTFCRLTTYIYIYMPYRTANLQTLHFKYLFNKSPSCILVF
jgi:hypothetical protein